MEEPEDDTPGALYQRQTGDAQRRAAQEELERQLIAGLDSGEPIPVTPEYWDELRRDLVQRHGTKSS